METISVNFLIKDSPSAVAILNKDLAFISYSDIWLRQFCKDYETLQEKMFADVLPQAPLRLKNELKESLFGKTLINPGTKFILENGQIQWLKWKIKPFKDSDGHIGGVTIRLEDITDEEREKELLLKAEVVARIGGWEVDLLNNKVYWSRMTRNIHEAPKNYEPNLEDGLDFYKAGETREKITHLVNLAITEGKPWDTELIIVTAKNNEVWVRTKGEAEMKNGKCIRIFGTFQDIDDKKKTELKYEEIAERLKVATQAANIGIWEYDIPNNKLVWDSKMYTLYGVNKEDFSGEYEAWEAGVHPDDKERGSLEIAQAISGEKEFDTEFRVLWPNGTTRNIRAIAQTERDEKGNAIKMIGVNWDITKTKVAERELSETAERLNVATRAANIGIWDFKIEENMVICNDNMYAMYDIPKDSSDLLDEWMKRIHSEDRNRIYQELQATIEEKKPFSTQFRGVKPNGKLVHFIAFGEAQSGPDGKTKKIIGANWDITELKKTKLRLERSQESFDHSFKNSVAGMALVGLDGKWIRVNEGLCESFGYTQEEFMEITWQEITHPEDLDSDLELLQQILNEEISTYQFEKRFYHKDGRLIHTLLTVTAAKDLNGKLSHLISQVLDITSRIEAEKKLKTLVEVTKGQNDSLLNFAHIVSHNLRSHSTNMSMLTSFLTQEENEEERENLNKMLTNAADSLSDTIQHLNEVVQVKTGALEKMQSVSLLNTILNIEKSIEGLLSEKQAITKINIKKSDFVMAVPAYLESIILNLYTNSLKYSSPNRKPLIEITSVVREDTIAIEFKDNGQGIDLKRHGDKIFGMYKTFHKHKEAKGIGLFITKNQIESMNGTIDVKSKVDKETVFYLTFKKG